MEKINLNSVTTDKNIVSFPSKSSKEDQFVNIDLNKLNLYEIELSETALHYCEDRSFTQNMDKIQLEKLIDNVVKKDPTSVDLDLRVLKYFNIPLEVANKLATFFLCNFSEEELSGRLIKNIRQKFLEGGYIIFSHTPLN